MFLLLINKHCYFINTKLKKLRKTDETSYQIDFMIFKTHFLLLTTLLISGM